MGEHAPEQERGGFQCRATQQILERWVALYRRRLARMQADLQDALDRFSEVSSEPSSGASEPLAKALAEVERWHPGCAVRVLPTDRMAKAGGKPPAGFSAAPRSQHGGYRKRSGRGWIYWYPDVQELVSAERRSPITPEQALAALGDHHDQVLLDEAKRIGRRLGLRVEHAAWQLGLWKGDADPSHTLIVRAGRRSTLRKAEGLAAALGHQRDQDGVLLVHPDPRGDSVLVRLPLPTRRDPLEVFRQLAPIVEGASIILDAKKRAIAVVIISLANRDDHMKVPEVAEQLDITYNRDRMARQCRQILLDREKYESILRREGLDDVRAMQRGSFARR